MNNFVFEIDGNSIQIANRKRYIFEGYSGASKEVYAKKLKDLAVANGYSVACIDCRRTVSSWFEGYFLSVPRTGEQRIIHIIEHYFCNDFMLILKFAEKITDSKLHIIMKLIKGSSTAVLFIRNYNKLHPKLKVEFLESTLTNLSGREIIDCTFFVFGFLLVLLALTGYKDIVFMLAATKYIFQGMKPK